MVCSRDRGHLFSTTGFTIKFAYWITVLWHWTNGGKLNSGLNKQNTHTFTSLHLNIQSLPAKFDNLKLLISELQEQDINLDLILLCETFINANIAHQFIKGYNLVYKNRTTATRGGVAIYINNKYNFIQRYDLAINTSWNACSIWMWAWHHQTY